MKSEIWFDPADKNKCLVDLDIEGEEVALMACAYRLGEDLDSQQINEAVQTQIEVVDAFRGDSQPAALGHHNLEELMGMLGYHNSAKIGKNQPKFQDGKLVYEPLDLRAGTLRDLMKLDLAFLALSGSVENFQTFKD